MVKDSFLNWGFKPSINTDGFTEGGYTWGGVESESKITLYFEMANNYAPNYIPNDNYDRPQGYWNLISVYFKFKDIEADGFSARTLLDNILISDVMVEDWVDNNWKIPQAIIDDCSEEYLENTDKVDIFWDFESYESATLKGMVFDNMDKVLIKSRGDFPE